MDDLAQRLQQLEERQMFDERFAEELHEQVLHLARSAEAIGGRLDRLERRLEELLAGDAEADDDGANNDLAGGSSGTSGEQ